MPHFNTKNYTLRKTPPANAMLKMKPTLKMTKMFNCIFLWIQESSSDDSILNKYVHQAQRSICVCSSLNFACHLCSGDQTVNYRNRHIHTFIDLFCRLIFVVVFEIQFAFFVFLSTFIQILSILRWFHDSMPAGQRVYSAWIRNKNHFHIFYFGQTWQICSDVFYLISNVLMLCLKKVMIWRVYWHCVLKDFYKLS